VVSRFQRLVSVLLLLVAAAAAQETLRSLSLLHVGDLHAGLLPDIQGRGGFARLATAIRREQQGCTSCLLVNGGDLVQGTPVSTLFRGLPVYQIAGLFHFEVSTLGNHDFDYGWQMTRRFLKAGVSPIVSANVVDGGGHLITRHGYVIRNVNGMRVAVIGALMGNLGNYETPAKLGPWHSLPPIETVRKIAAELAGRADVIVLLGHLEAAEQAAVLHEAPEIAVTIGAHVHTGLKEAQEFEHRLWVRGDCCGRELGRLDLKVDVPAKKVASWNWKRIPIDATIPPAGDMAARVAKWEKRVSKIVDVPIGESRREIEKLDLQRLVERAMAEETSADFGLVNLSGLRDKLPQGRLLARHVWNVMPFDNKVVIGKFKGSELPPVVAKAHQVDPDREYTLVTIDFIVETGALGTRGLTFPQTGPLLRDLLIDWIKKKQVIQ
jgi:2',3'-cyclic-nucleotide 2'-phosphodiesterase (5'-nucleotidase family)